MSLRCGEAERWISIRVDGEPMPPSESLRLEEHLELCPGCREFLEVQSSRAGILGGALGRGDASFLAQSIVEEAASLTFSADPPSAEWIPGGRRLPASVPAWMSAAAALIIGAILVAWFVVPDSSPTDGVTLGPPPGRVTPDSSNAPDSSPLAGLRFVFEVDAYDADVVPATDGSPLEKGTRWRRRVIFGAPEGREGSWERKRDEYRQVDTKYLRLVDYPYR